MTGLFFGSFNPIHNGHLEIASYLLDHRLCDTIYFVVSPQNPFKEDSSLLEENKRLELVEKAIAGDPRMKASDIEFSMPRPSYTIDTLRRFSAVCPDTPLALIIGEDNLRSFHLWKDYTFIADHYNIFVYPRSGTPTFSSPYPHVTLLKAPLFPLSSTEIRHKVQKGEDITNFVPKCIASLVLRYYR